MDRGFELTTRVFKDGQIHQHLDSVQHGARHRLQTHIVDTGEHQIRKALRLLGWSPPQATHQEQPSFDVDSGRVTLCDGSAPLQRETVGRPGLRLAHPVMISSATQAATALNHIVDAAEADLATQGRALQDYAVPALRWALMRIAMLEHEASERRR